MKISVSQLKEKGNEHGISFPGMLASVVMEDLLKRIFSTSFSKVICLRNVTDFGETAYRKAVSRKIDLYYCEKQIIPDIKSPGAPVSDEILFKIYSEMFADSLVRQCLEDITVSSQIKDNSLELVVRFDKFEVPAIINFIPVPEASFRATGSEFKLFTNDNIKFFIYEYPAERILSDIGFEIFQKLELLGEMGMYLEAYDILSTKTVSGRVVKEGLIAYCGEDYFSPSMDRLNALRGYKDYKYMQKKWKVLLRREKRNTPTWNEALALVLDFYGPIWQAVCENGVFLDDWMYELRKFM